MRSHFAFQAGFEFSFLCLNLWFLGIILEYEQSGMMKSKSIDLLDLKPT